MDTVSQGREPSRPPPGALDLHLPSGSVRLRYVRTAERILLVSDRESNRWPFELVAGGTARLTLPEGEAQGTARWLVDPGEVRSALGEFEQAYARDGKPSWLENPVSVVEVRLGSSAMPTRTYAEIVEAEFDRAARTYDDQIGRNRIDLELRERSVDLLRHTFQTGSSLLELGCGTGRETLALLEDGHEVTCIDISSRMLQELRSKAAARGLGERLRTERSALGDWAHRPRAAEARTWEGGFSTYGALNCEPDLAAVSRQLHAVLSSRAPFVAGSLNRWPMFELLADAGTGQWARLAARAKAIIPVGRSRFGIEVYPHSPADLHRLFLPWFAPRDVRAVGVVLPPPDRLRWTEPFRDHWRTMVVWDRWLGDRWPFRLLGEYSLMTFEQRPDVPRDDS